MRYLTPLLLGVLLGIIGFPTSVVAEEKAFPVPTGSSNRLFYIQRSNDINTIMYEANLTASQQLNPKEPVSVYWIRYAERGQRESLSLLQWKLAYGYQHQATNRQAGGFDIQLHAFKKRTIRVAFHHGRPTALTTISGQEAALQRIFVQLAPRSGLMPKVQYLELFGTDLDGQPIYERIAV